MSRPEIADHATYAGAEFDAAVEWYGQNRDNCPRPRIPYLRRLFPTLSMLDCCGVIRAVNLAERWPEKAGGA